MTYRFSMQDDLSLLEYWEIGDEMAQDECLETRDARLGLTCRLAKQGELFSRDGRDSVIHCTTMAMDLNLYFSPRGEVRNTG